MYIVVFIYGVLFGSFFNVVGYRLPNNLSLVKPGSFCPKCSHSLKWYELIPIFSYLIQFGKCRKCKTHISYIYPAIEILTGLLFMFSYFRYGLSVEFLLLLFISSFFIIVLVSDINYLIIPDEVTIFFTLATIIVYTFISNGIIDFIHHLSNGIAMFIIMYLIMRIGSKVFNEEALGGGDVKLMFFIGLILGIINGFFTIFLASLISLPFAIFGTYSKKFRLIPFGPFLLGSCFIIYYFNLNLFDIIELFV